jgi:CBS domain-containing protein
MESLLREVLAEKAALSADGRNVVHTVTPERRSAEAIGVMCEANVGCVLVIDEGKLVGIVSERDVMHRIANLGLSPDSLRVSDVMTTNVFTVSPTITVEQALVECTDRRIRHLPVADGGKLVGLLSIGDLVRSVVKDKDRTIADLIDYIHGPQIEV